MEKEQHPYLKHFDGQTSWKHLIIGTFPPNKEVREEDRAFVDYFYGNKGSFWTIVDKIYPQYKLKESLKPQRIAAIKQWQKDYSIGITDTIKCCTRKNPKSSSDADLIFNRSDLNLELKNYILSNINSIEKMYFTSTEGEKSAFETFRQIMSADMSIIPQHKLIKDIVSPSNAVNQSLFNRNNNDTLGLENGLYHFISCKKPELMPFYKRRWEQKQKKKLLEKVSRKDIALENSPEGIVSEYKYWSYKQVLPKLKS